MNIPNDSAHPRSARSARRWRAATLFLLPVVVGLVPVKTTVVPPIQVQVQDQAGKPVSRAIVRVVWSYPLASDQQLERSTLSRSGHAAFPAATITASLTQRLWATIQAVANLPGHGSLGKHSRLSVWAPGFQSWSQSELDQGGSEYRVILRVDPSGCGSAKLGGSIQ